MIREEPGPAEGPFSFARPSLLENRDRVVDDRCSRSWKRDARAAYGFFLILLLAPVLASVPLRAGHGLRRTYPHLLTTEAVRGLEVDKWSDWCDPEHEVTLAFTRLLLGEMDLTPGGFNNVTRAEFKDRRRQPMVMGTRCRQLAMYVIYESPLQMVSDYPAAYRGEPAFEFIRRVPTVWDETRVLLAEVADLIVIARRRGEEWFLGGMTDWTPREIVVPLDFLGEGRYVAEIYADGEDADTRPKGVRISMEEVDRESVLRVRLAAGGGVAVRVRPKQYFAE